MATIPRKTTFSDIWHIGNTGNCDSKGVSGTAPFAPADRGGGPFSDVRNDSDSESLSGVDDSRNHIGTERMSDGIVEDGGLGRMPLKSTSASPLFASWTFLGSAAR